MDAIIKGAADSGFTIAKIEEREVPKGYVKVNVHYGAICGTDLHIYQWDEWSASRIKPPRIVGHEFSGIIVDVGEGVSKERIGERVASESHIVCGCCKQCLQGDGHVCTSTKILGIDIDGGFAKYAIIPSDNARRLPECISLKTGGMLDAVGNGVHTCMSSDLVGKSVLITGLGPIGLFSVSIAKALGARRVVGLEVSKYRTHLAEVSGIDMVVNPITDNVDALLRQAEPEGFDVCLEMSGRRESLGLITDYCRAGGDIRLLGLYPDNTQCININKWIFQGYDVKCIVGRRLWDTWDKMLWLFEDKGLNLDNLITHEYGYQDYDEAMEILGNAAAGKIVLNFEDAA